MVKAKLLSKQMLASRVFPLVALLALLAAPLFLSDFRLSLLAKFLTYAIVALGIDLIWGYGGMLSLGHGVFFGLGAYAMAMYLKLEASGSHLPDFMGWSGLDELPWFWEPFHSPLFAILMAVVIPALLAFLLGYLIFRSRIQGVYFSIITQALSLIIVTLFIGQQPLTGGTNGMTNFSTAFGFTLADPAVQVALYFVTVLFLVLAYLLCRWLMSSRYGRLLVASREDENRLRFMGYNPAPIKSLAFGVSGGLAGIAGALFVLQVGLITPSNMAIVPSIEMVIWVAVGGRGTLWGAVLGTLLVNYGKSTFSESFPEIWQYFFGGLFVGAVLLFPSGIAGFIRNLWEKPFFKFPPQKPKEKEAELKPSGSELESGVEVN
jgi:urea transport system permease protein